MEGSKSRYLEVRRGRVEIIPMIDVMLFLLVFFIIVTLQMIPDSGLALKLPASSQSERLEHPEVTVNLHKDGHITVKHQTLDAAGLTALLRALPDPAHAQVTIAADRDTPVQQLLRIMDASRAAGVSDVGLAATPESAVPAAP